MDGKITEFKDLMAELFYDFGSVVNQGGQEINQEIEDDSISYFVNKGAIFKRDNKYHYQYKTESYEITNDVIEKMHKFYEFYNNDIEFQSILNKLEEKILEVKNYNENKIELKDNTKFLYHDNRCYMDNEEISQETFKKVKKLLELTKTKKENFIDNLK